MCIFKRLSILILTAFFAVGAAMGQSSEREMTIEESYLMESVELMIIRETSRADGMDQKLVALEFIGNAIERGNTSNDIRQALEFLSLEGTLNQTRENGRVVNNFPLVRREAARYLGQIRTQESTDALLKIIITDDEPMVIQEAIRSLGEIGINNDNQTVEAIVWIVTRYDFMNPDNLMALAAIDAFEKIAAANNGIRDPNVVRLLIRISEGPYIRPVQDRARQAIQLLLSY